MRTLAIGTCLVLMKLSLWAGTRDAQWKRVEEAVRQGLPRTAITNLEPIIAAALRDKAYAEAVKAIGKRIVLEGNIQGNKPEEKITRLEAETARAPKEMVPMLDTLLAHWYWQYFEQNRWRFLQRTATAQPPGKDFTAWDLPRLFREIDRQFQKALSAQALLKATPISAWEDLLQKGTMPDAYRPTLYDFIGHEALEFYSSGEQAAAKSQNDFELSAASPALDAAEAFLLWNPGPQNPSNQPGESADGGFSPTLRALRLYQDLLRFHQADPAPWLAFASADLERLAWAWNAAFGEKKNERYKSALETFSKTYGDYEISAQALAAEARVWQQDGDLVKAHDLAERGGRLFPGSVGGRLCRNLVTELEAKSASLSTERVWTCLETSGSGFPQPPNTPEANKPAVCATIALRYRNVTAVYFRAIPYDWEIFLQQRHNRPENLSDAERRQVLSQTAALQWSETLPATTDYQEKTAVFDAPDKLKPGFYFIAASHDPKFGEKANVVSMAPIWVSDLALVTRTRNGQVEGFVLAANSGEPLPGAEISIWHLDRNGVRVADPALKTDENGFFEFKTSENRGYLVRARYLGREVASVNDLWGYNYQDQVVTRPQAQTVFFTDRAIYRPGQTIQFKGICLWVDQAGDDYKVLEGEKLTVVFRDQNGKEIARQSAQANDYGSFSGSFVAPRDRLMGPMSLQVDGRAQGMAWVRVEEYKRPKFQVTLDAPKTAAKLNDSVSLGGHAMTYAGAPVDGAPVRYRVVREARMPWWWGWYSRPWRGSESQEIAHGTVTTETDGSFKIEFTAKADPKVPESDEPTFVYQVNADVTDSAGETRSAEQSVRIGYTALEATLSAADWQVAAAPVEIAVNARTLDQEPQVAEGRVLVYDLRAPARPQPAPLQPGQLTRFLSRSRGAARAEEKTNDDLSNPNNWPLGKVVAESGFTTDTNGAAKLSFKLPAGAYRALLETQDRFGKKVGGKLPLVVLEPEASRLEIRVPHLLDAPAWQAHPGGEFGALWGTGYESGRAFVEVEHRGKMVQRYWTQPGRTQQQIKVLITEAMRGGFTLHVTQVREDRAYLDSRKVEVPWLDKELDIKWEHFVSRLEPSQKETWTAVVSRRVADDSTKVPATDRKLAEMAATLYDESLDAFAPLNWPQRFDIFRQDYSTLQAQFANQAQGFQHALGNWGGSYSSVQITYRSFPGELTAGLRDYQFFESLAGRERAKGAVMLGRGLAVDQMSLADGAVAAAAPMAANAIVALGGTARKAAAEEPATAAGLPPGQPGGSKPSLDQVVARRNLNETAFFFPQLTAESNGLVRMTFTMPEALTKWRFLAFAHDRSVRSGSFEDHVVSSKELMVQPNAPRFLREGDVIEFTVKVSNQSDRPQSGIVRVTFQEALNGQTADKLLQVQAVATGRDSAGARPAANGNEQTFDIPAKQSRGFAWRITVPDGCGFLTYKAVAAAAALSDGEEGAVPVLSRRILVTESLPLPIRGPGSKKFEMARLLKSGGSRTLQNQSLTVQMASHPAWYAVLALPYLMEYPHECSEQVFNRLYANTLARTVAASDPKIHRVFEQWRNTPALESPLEKNQDLKNVALEETPWLRQAESESQARKNIGILFEDNRLNYETDRTLEKLAQMQLADGSWPWFPGGRGNDYITLYITTGFGRLRHLGADINVAPAVRALARLDLWMNESYERIQSHPDPDKYVPSATDALYLYGRSFFLKDQPIAAASKKAVDFFLNQSRKFWLKTDCRQTQGQLALALARFDASAEKPDPTPAAIMNSLKERSVSTEEMGMFWRETELSWWWYRAPIETQALMIEAFDEIMHDATAVENCQVWLLKQKQTQNWKTTKATADAVYALLLRGKELLSSDALVQVKLDGIDVTPTTDVSNSRTPGPDRKGGRPEAGTGFYEVRFTDGEIKPKFGEITVRKTDAGVAWGGIHWQYLEDMSKVTPYEGTPLKLKKELFTRTATSRGQELQPIKGPVKVGDELVVRIELRVDRDMEYVHMKDQRGSGTEPVNVLSQYKYQDGLSYYESTRDTATHFFIDYLPKGTYVFEYATRVQLRGRYQTGVTEIQCMYAPEFGSHSGSVGLTVN
jgi:hypothetical protein